MESLLWPLLERPCWILSYLAMPCVWTETLFFCILDLDASTSFRMFPSRNIYPGYAGAEYAYALLAALHIPYLVSSDRRPDERGTLGAILRPLTKRASLSVVFFIMFARVWLWVAW